MIKIILQIFILTNIYAFNIPQSVCNGVGEIKYANALYTGECKNNKRDGRGRVVFDDGAKYEGDWKDDKKNGHGTQYYRNGMIYNGEWMDGFYHGNGVLKYTTKEKYDGSWIMGKKDGQGIYTYANSSSYDGAWSHDKKDGYGVFKYNNGIIYKGNFSNNIKDGEGSITYPSGDKYEGGFTKEKYNGYGVFTFAKGGSYAGDWVMGNKTGKGKYIYLSGAIYDGSWVNNIKDGKGKYIDTKGNIYIGSWKNNKKNGHGKLALSSGEIYEGNFKDDKKEGHGVLTYASERVYDGEWHNDKKNGLGVETTQYGTCEGRWKDSKLVSIDNEYSYDEAYAHFNKIRKSVGMIELRTNPVLQDAAQSHSDYIGLHNSTMKGMDFHHEKVTNEGFKGVEAEDRVIKAGYFSTLIGEGISNYCNAQESITSLMSAIYHRFVILDFDKNEVGIGFTQYPHILKRNFVHNTGNSKLNVLCQNDNYWFGSYFKEVCADEKLKIKIDQYNEAKDEIRERNPKYVIWPVDGSVDNLYYFKDEVPDPMPGFAETGNPISIHFNPFYFTEDVVVYSFKLYNGDEEITETRLLTKQTDPNKKFTKYEYALFPHKPLERDTEYKVVIKYKYNGSSKRISSTFSTLK